MEKMKFKFNAMRVDEIEKSKGMPIDNCILDNTIGNLASLVAKAVVREDGAVGCTKNVAMDIIDEYLKVKDKDDLLFDIAEGLIEAGFLSRALNVEQMREQKNKETQVLSTTTEAI